MDKNLDIQIVEALKAYLASGVEDQVDYQKFYLYSIVTHSTAIEGSTVTEIENQLLFDEGKKAPTSQNRLSVPKNFLQQYPHREEVDSQFQ